jgi:ribosomal protein L29
MKDLKKIKSAKDKDLLKEVNALKEKNRIMKSSASSSNSKDSFGRRKNRKNIARILTELNQRNK